MREPQRLDRSYHGHPIVSIQATEPDPDGDGWDHEVFDEAGKSCGVFNSLGAAIQCAKRAKYPGKYPEEIESTETLEPEQPEQPEQPETNPPETEETE